MRFSWVSGPGTPGGGEDGQATLEILVSLMVALSLVFCLFELCMFTYTCSVLNEATQEGVRYAIVHGIDSTLCSGPDTTLHRSDPLLECEGSRDCCSFGLTAQHIRHDDYSNLRQQHRSDRQSGRGHGSLHLCPLSQSPWPDEYFDLHFPGKNLVLGRKDVFARALRTEQKPLRSFRDRPAHRLANWIANLARPRCSCW